MKPTHNQTVHDLALIMAAARDIPLSSSRRFEEMLKSAGFSDADLKPDMVINAMVLAGKFRRRVGV